MYITGSFANQQGDTVTVHIVTGADKSEVLEIGTESSGLYFTDDPAEIVSEVNDTFDHLLRQSATIRLLSRNFIPDFFSTSCRNAVVNIYKGDVCVFAGFIEPQTYSQPYNEVYDEIELNCIDALSALQYSKYKNVGALGVLYDVVKSEAAQRPLLDIMQEVLKGVVTGIDIVGGHTMQYFYDGSKAVDDNESNRYSVFNQMSISELLFLGDEEDDVWQQDEVLEEVLRYLNLHIIQDGFTFYIFSWETVKGQAPITWRDIVSGSEFTTTRDTVSISMDNVADCDTTISIGEVYNQLLLTCNIDSVENVIESPLDDDLLVDPYLYKQKYMTEYSAKGKGLIPATVIVLMVQTQKTTEPYAASITNWYIRLKSHPSWTFYLGGRDLSEYYANGTHQEALLDALAWAGGPSAFLSAFGSVTIDMGNSDNAPTSSIDMTNCLYVKVPGTIYGDKTKDTEEFIQQTGEIIRLGIPCAEYVGKSADGVFSPADEEITNYIVISGKIALIPEMDVSEDIYRIKNNLYKWEDWANNTMPSRNGDRLYTRQYWKAERPSQNPDDVEWNGSDSVGIIPFTSDCPQYYKFNYSEVGDNSDKISKVSVLACMLIIGGKCVVEKTPDNDLGTGVPYTGNGWPQDFVWVKYKTLEECKDEDEYYQQCFTIGFNPKIGDMLIGTEYELQTNHDYTYGIEANGIAIPIKKNDKVSGGVKFIILGPVNLVWNNITRRHPTFFRSTKWTENDVALMARVTGIAIKSFEVKLYSDSGMLTDGQADNDVIYMSDTKETFTNKKDDLEFKISSDLTLEECKKLGVSTGLKLSTPLNTTTGNGVLTIYDYARKTQAKAEQFYVDSYYNEYHVPRVIMEQKLLDVGGIVGLFNHYRHLALNKEFFVQGISRNLMEGRADMKLKEIGE